MGFGIAVVFPLLIHYGILSFVPIPPYADYFPNYAALTRPGATQTEKAKALAQTGANEMAQQKAYNEAVRKYDLTTFFATLPFGIAAILAGVFLNAPGIGPGLVFGGLFTLIDCFWSSWGMIDDRLKFIAMLATFILLVVLGYKKSGKSTG